MQILKAAKMQVLTNLKLVSMWKSNEKGKIEVIEKQTSKKSYKLNQFAMPSQGKQHNMETVENNKQEKHLN